MSTATVDILIPVLDRPQNVAPLVESIAATTPVPWHILFIPTLGYADEMAAIHEAMSAHDPWPEDDDEPWPTGVVSSLGQRPQTVGDYARKINNGVRSCSAPYLFFGADDLRFLPGWFDAALHLMSQEIGVVGTNDLGPWRPNSPSRNAVRAGEHATHCLVARWYCALGLIDDDPFPPQARVLNEEYPHEFVDDEFCATARSRHAWAYATGSHVEHLHPNLGKGESDESYRRSVDRIPAGRALYRSRAHLWGEDPPKR